MSEDPKKVFGCQDCYEPTGAVLRVTQGHVGHDGAPLMIFGIYGPEVDGDKIHGKTVRMGPGSVEMLAMFIADYLGTKGLPISQPHWFMETKAGGALARVDGRVRVVARTMMPGGPVKWAAQRVVDGKGDALVRDSKKRIRYFPTPKEAAEFADQYAPMGVNERGVTAVEIEPSVHILWEGLPLCRFTHKVPDEWPEGHTWVSYGHNSGAGATCEHCIEEKDE